MALFLSFVFFIIMVSLIYWDIHFNNTRKFYRIIMTFFLISSINVVSMIVLQGYITEQHRKSNVIIKTYDIEGYNTKLENDKTYLYFNYYENDKEYNKRVLLSSFESIDIKNDSGILKYTYIPGNDNIWFPVFEKNISLTIVNH